MNEKILYFDQNFTEVYYWGFNWQDISICSGNGLMPNRQQAITWANADPILWRIYAALGGDELIINYSIHGLLFKPLR